MSFPHLGSARIIRWICGWSGSFKAFFTPIFFVYIGLSLNLREIEWSSPFIWGFSLTIFVLAIIGKMLGPFFLKESIQSRVAIGIAMVPRGEIGLIFAELGRISGI